MRYFAGSRSRPILTPWHEIVVHIVNGVRRRRAAEFPARSFGGPRRFDLLGCEGSGRGIVVGAHPWLSRRAATRRVPANRCGDAPGNRPGHVDPDPSSRRGVIGRARQITTQLSPKCHLTRAISRLGGEMTVLQRHISSWFTSTDSMPKERPRPIEAVMMAAVILIGVIATNALV